MKIMAANKTKIGNFRKNNEDAYIFLKNKTGQTLAAVCDGLGGHSCGEIASNTTINLLKKYFINTNWNKIFSQNEIFLWLKNTIKQIQQEMIEYSKINNETFDMGTTLSLLLIFNNQAFLANVGDSRIYLFNDKGLNQLTTDHNVLNMILEKQVKISVKDQNKTYWKTLTSALGPNKTLEISTFNLQINNPCYFLLTTDGVHDYLESWEITEVLKANFNLKKKIKKLMKTAIKNFSTDNLTVLLIYINV